MVENEIKHKVFWEDELQIVHAIGDGIADEPAAQFLLARTEQMAKEHGNGLNWLLDLNGITKTTSAGRKILAKASGHPSIHKYAMVGASTVMRTVANFINATGGQSNARHFSTEEEALRWLKEDK